MENALKLQLEKMASMQIAGVPSTQIALATGLSEGRISQLHEEPIYLEILQALSAKDHEKQELLNQGWDSVEAMSVGVLVRELQGTPEPEFALRAAQAANKAVRRGQFKNNPIAQNMGLKAVVMLNPTFVDKLQQNFDVTKTNNEDTKLEKKECDFLAPNAVQKLLHMGKDDDEVLKDLNFNTLEAPQNA